MDQQCLDYVVVGAGMIGSSAAKYICEKSKELGMNVKVAVIGVEEAGGENSLYGAWHDEGRITRLIDKSDCWRVLAERSILKYRGIEEASGIRFYQEAGFLSLIDDKYQDTERLRDALEKLRNLGYEYDDINDNTRFPYFNISSPVFGYFQPDHAGYINPRRLVEAQLQLAVSQGCQVIRSGVVGIADLGTGEKEIQLQEGGTVRARNVLLATGAYINISGLLTPFTPSALDITLTTQTVAFIRISESEAMRLRGMPTVVTTYHSGSLDGTYILPPILYPDGHYYLKLGHHDKFERIIETKEELEAWYNDGRGDQAAVEELTRFIRSFLPGLEVEAVVGGCCVTSKTKDKAAPYIDSVGEGLWVACGGCGYAAKSCDEIGNIAASLLLTGVSPDNIDRELFRVKFK